MYLKKTKAYNKQTSIPGASQDIIPVWDETELFDIGIGHSKNQTV